MPDLLRWGTAMAEEIVALPTLMRDARRLVNDLAAVTEQLADTTDSLSRLVAPLLELDIAGIVGKLPDDVSAVVAPIDRALAQVDNIERSTTELRNATFALLRRLPGARGVVVDAVPTATDEMDRATE